MLVALGYLGAPWRRCWDAIHVRRHPVVRWHAGWWPGLKRGVSRAAGAVLVILAIAAFVGGMVLVVAPLRHPR